MMSKDEDETSSRGRHCKWLISAMIRRTSASIGTLIATSTAEVSVPSRSIGARRMVVDLNQPRLCVAVEKNVEAKDLKAWRA